MRIDARRATRRLSWEHLPRWSRCWVSSSPTSLFSVSNSVSIYQREPPTRARVSNGVSPGALDGLLGSLPSRFRR